MLKSTFSILLAILRWARRSILLIGCIFFLTLNVLTLTSTFVQSALASSLGIMGIKSVYSTLDTSLKSKDRSIRKQKNINRKLSSDLSKEKQFNRTVKSDYKIEREKRIALQTDIQRRKDGVKNIGRGVSSRTLRLAGMNVAAVPMEAVPVAGVFAILTVTAAELHMTCANIADIDQIYLTMGIETDNTQATVACMNYISEFEDYNKDIGQLAEKITKWIDPIDDVADEIEESAADLTNSLYHEYDEAAHEVDEWAHEIDEIVGEIDDLKNAIKEWWKDVKRDIKRFFKKVKKALF